jgi:hypothetical protein
VRYLKATTKHLLGLVFVDARFTVALSLWIAVSACVPLIFHRQNTIGAVVFFGGFVTVLVENLVHVAGNSRTSSH